MVVNSHPLYQLSYRGSEIVPDGNETIVPFTSAPNQGAARAGL